MLDPLADKLLIDTAFILFALNNYIPDWIAIVIISRDVLLIIGWILMYMITSNIKVEPSIFGKITNFFESTSVMLLLLNAVFAFNYNLEIEIYMYITVLLCTISLVDYSIKGIKKFG